MPRKPKRPCSYSGCPNLAVDGRRFCKEHLKEERASYDRYQRDPEHGKRYSFAWRRVRARYVEKHPLCERCLKEGRLVPVEEVHHIVPLSRGGTNDESNLMSLCQSCHMKIHHEIGDR